MEHGSDASDHREYEDLLAAAALGALTPDEHARLRQHLPTCASCREAYRHLLGVAEILPLAVEEREPPAALRERLRAQVGAPVTPAPPAAATPPEIVPLRIDVPVAAPEPVRPPRRIARQWLAIAAAMLLIGLVAGALLGRYLLTDEGGPAGQQIAMQAPTGMDLGDATLTWMPNEKVLMFSAPDLAAPPEGHVYQVWMIAGESAPPTPMGTVDQATGEFAMPMASGRHGTFAVTVEPGPLGSPAPTTDPVIVAPLG